MSKDWKPIDHILANCTLMLRGEINEFPFEKPYAEMHYQDGRIVPLTDKECSVHFPYVTFFTTLPEYFQENKDNSDFLKRMALLEKDLRQIVNNVYADLKIDKTAIHEEKWFENLSGNFSDLKDFIQAENDYKFDYDCEWSQARFTAKFMDDVEKENDAPNIEIEE